MTRTKAFWLSFLCTLAALLPLYAIVYYGKTLTAYPGVAAAAPESKISVNQPTVQDSRNLLLVVKGEKTRFLLLRVDAWQQRFAVAALRGDTLLRSAKGGTVSVQAAWEYAGPGYTAERIGETLGISIDHYLQLNQSSIIALGEKIGAVHINAQTMALAQANSSSVGSDTVALSAQNIADLVCYSELEPEQETPFLARVYALFLCAGADRLETLIPQLLRAGEKGLSTSILAPEIYDYQKIFTFFVRKSPKVDYTAFPGEASAEGFVLASDAPALATTYFS
ncbi:MAG: LCP family protein [Pygmaiobacter sp.]